MAAHSAGAAQGGTAAVAAGGAEDTRRRFFTAAGQCPFVDRVVWFPVSFSALIPAVFKGGNNITSNQNFVTVKD